MNEIILQDVENLKVGENLRQFIRGINEFLPLFFSEYAMSLNLNSDTELYKTIRMCLQDEYISTNELLQKLEQDNQIGELISQFPNDDDIDKWSIFLRKCSWSFREGNNIFRIDGKEYIMPEQFLHLVSHEGRYYAYRYFYDKSDGSCQFAVFNYERNPLDPIPIDNPFLFKKEKLYSNPASEIVKKLELSDEEFFDLPMIRSSDDEQKEAICASMDKNIVVLAGAGSGKTRTLVSRLVYLHLVKKIPLDRILLLTFTKSAADNMKIRGEEIMIPIYERITEGRNKPNIRAKTIDAFVYSVIRENYQEIGFTEDPILKLDGSYQSKEEYQKFVNQIIMENDMLGIFSRYYYGGKPNGFFHYLVEDLEKYACGMSINYAGIERLLNEVIRRQIETHTVYGFAYCNYLVKEAIKNPNSALSEIIASRYDCILIDEFQDINALQNDTFEPFYNSKMHFTFVGDDDQSIYGWRGSDNSIIKKLVSNPNVQTYYLLTNYRNNPNIVKAGNIILNQISGRAKKDQPIKPYKKTGPKIRISTYDDKYTNLTNEVNRLIKDGYSSEDITILTRKKEDKTNIARALTAAEIPVARERVKIDVNDNYKLLKAIMCILNEYNITPSCREIKRICNSSESTEYSVQKMICGKELPTDELKEACVLAAELSEHKVPDMAKAVELYSLKAGELFEKTINDYHSDPVFEAFMVFCSNNSVPWPASAKQLREVLRTFEDNTRKENQSLGNLENGVKISTIHNAKGLEYSVVIITGLTMGKYPDTELIDQTYNRRCTQLESLKGSRQAFDNLKASVNATEFLDMIRECSNTEFDKTEATKLTAFCQEIKTSGQRNITQLTAQGVSDFLDSYRCHIEPLEKRYIDIIARAQKQALMYKERQEILSEEISLLTQGEADSEEKRLDLEEITKKYKSKLRAIERNKDRLDRFDTYIKTIRKFYKICLTASSYLAELMKLNEIEKLKRLLEEEKEKSINEERRLFYVALTRAKDLLYLCNESGAPKSQFIEIIPDELKEEYAILTKDEERDLRRIKKSLENNLKQESINDSLFDSDTNKLVENPNFKEIISKKYVEYIRINPIYRELPQKAEEYFKKAMGLLHIGEYTGVNFNTEFAHNIQRCVEALLLSVSGSKAVPLKTDDTNLIKRIANDIHSITQRCSTLPLGYAYIQDLLTKESKYGDELKVLKSAGIFHFIIRSGRYRIPKDILSTWTHTSRFDDEEQFLIAVTDISNTRNTLIHPSDKKWQNDPILGTLDNLQIVIKNCRNTVPISNKNCGLVRDPLYMYRIDKGVKVKHVDLGEGIISGVGHDTFTVNFNTIGEKIFMNTAAEKYFIEITR